MISECYLGKSASCRFLPNNTILCVSGRLLAESHPQGSNLLTHQRERNGGASKKGAHLHQNTASCSLVTGKGFQVVRISTKKRSVCSLQLCSRAGECVCVRGGLPTGKPCLGEECWSPSLSQGEARVRPAVCLRAQEGWGLASQ